jgi:hypothetical protein
VSATSVIGKIQVEALPTLASGVAAQVAAWNARRSQHKYRKDVCVKCGCDLTDPKDARWLKPCEG